MKESFIPEYLNDTLGAGMASLVMLVSRDFLFLVLFAAIPAFVLAWLVIRQWLENFAFRADLNFAFLGLVLLLTMVLTLLTTGGRLSELRD